MLLKELGGRGCNCIDLAIVLEEIGTVDASIACSYFNLNAAMSLFVTRVATQEQQKRILSFVNSETPHLFSAAEG
jgi:alkylation response protein AidB-like acyl-CoA dehydrogenase